MREWIAMWAQVPEGVLDTQGRDMCFYFCSTSTGDDLFFLRNLLDLTVRYSWSSDFVVRAMHLFLEKFPERPEDAKVRRSQLEAWGF